MTTTPDTLVERLRKAASDFESMRAYAANSVDSDCEPFYSDQTDMAEATQAALDAISYVAQLERELADARAEVGRFKSERSYIIGFNDGWESALEQSTDEDGAPFPDARRAGEVRK